MASFSAMVSQVLSTSDFRPQGHPNPVAAGASGHKATASEKPAAEKGHSGAGGPVQLAAPGTQTTAFAAAQANGKPSQMHPNGQKALPGEGSAGFGMASTQFNVQPPSFATQQPASAQSNATVLGAVTGARGYSLSNPVKWHGPCPDSSQELKMQFVEPIVQAEARRKRPREVDEEEEPRPRQRVKTHGREEDFSAMHTELLGVILQGVARLRKLGQADMENSSAVSWYGPNKVEAALKWARSAARCAATDPRTSPPEALLHARAAVKHADIYKPFFLRAALKQSKLVVEDDGVEYHVCGVEEEEEEEDDEVEGIRSKFTADVPKYVLPRPTYPPQAELRMIQQVVWDPREERAQRVSQKLHELERSQPWRGVLPSYAQYRDGREPSHLEATRGYRHIMYVPDVKAIKALRESQNAHLQQIIEVVGPEKAIALGLAGLSGHKELMRWSYKDRAALEEALSSKGITDDGLEYVRKQACPHIRMPNVADYYFKVWRTMTTPASQQFYAQKLKNKYEKLRKDHDRARKLPRTAPEGVYQSAADVPMRSSTPTLPGNHGSASLQQEFSRGLDASRQRGSQPQLNSHANNTNGSSHQAQAPPSYMAPYTSVPSSTANAKPQPFQAATSAPLAATFASLDSREGSMPLPAANDSAQEHAIAPVAAEKDNQGRGANQGVQGTDPAAQGTTPPVATSSPPTDGTQRFDGPNKPGTAPGVSSVAAGVMNRIGSAD